TILWADSSSTGDSRLRGALPIADMPATSPNQRRRTLAIAEIGARRDPDGASNKHEGAPLLGAGDLRGSGIVANAGDREDADLAPDALGGDIAAFLRAFRRAQAKYGDLSRLVAVIPCRRAAERETQHEPHRYLQPRHAECLSRGTQAAFTRSRHCPAHDEPPDAVGHRGAGRDAEAVARP